MHTRTLGRDGPNVSAIGVGALSFTDFYGATTEDESHAILDCALELGITLIDTSNIYGAGQSERRIGSFLAARGGNTRERFQISTKAGISRDPDSGARVLDNSAEHLAAELEASLSRLGTDHVDLFYIHRREAGRAIEEVTETLAGLVKAGKTRGFGFSEIAPTSLRRAAKVHSVAAVQSEYSLTTRSPDLGLVAACAEVGAAMVAFSPVGRGLLTDAPPRVAHAAFLQGNPRFTEPNLAANNAAIEPLRRLAAEMGVPTAALAIAWLLARGEHVLPIPGTRSVAHLRDLAKGADLRLNADDMARIEQAFPAGSAHGDRYTAEQWDGVERFC